MGIRGYLWCILLVVMAGLIVAPETARAVRCHNFTPGNPVPGGYGAAYSFQTQRMFITGNCLGQGIAVEVGDNAQTTYVFNTSYHWNGTNWVPLTLNGNTPAGPWYVGLATGTIRVFAPVVFYIAYICERVSDEWKCGCTSRACEYNRWQVQSFINYRASGGTGGPRGGPGGGGGGGGGGGPDGVDGGPFLGSTNPPYLQTTTGKIVRVHVRFFGAVGPTDGWNAGRGSHLPDIKRYLDQNPNNMVVYSYGLMPGSEGRDGASLGRCANGEFNTHYQAFAETAKNLGLRKLIIRPGWEYNIGGWPWSVGNNPERRPLYIACWRQFVDTLRRTYPENQFLFDLNLVYGVSREYLEGTYPGNNYVDLVGADIYDRCYASAAICNDPNRRWLEWHQPRLEVIRAFAQDPARNKPFSIPEWGLYRAGYDQYSGGDNPRFIQGICQWVANPANRVIYYSYFAPSGNDRHPDLAQSPLSLAAFRQYCNGNQRSVSDELWR